MNLVDSSGWMEYLADGSNAPHFASAIEDTARLVVPTICLFEVFKRVLQQRNEDAALQAVAKMRQARVLDFDTDLALSAAQLALVYRLPMADSIILAAGQATRSIIWTQDSDFEGIEGVRYFAKH